MTESIGYFWVDKRKRKARDAMDTSSPLPPDVQSKYAFYGFDADNIPVLSCQKSFVGLIDDESEPSFFQVVDWKNEMPIIKRCGNTYTCASFAKSVYTIEQDEKLPESKRVGKVQVLRKIPQSDEEEDRSDIFVTIVPYYDEYVDACQFLTWEFPKPDTSEWPASLQFISEGLKNGFVIAPTTLSIPQLSADLTSFAGPPMHPLEQKLGFQIFVHCGAVR
jgi:hypothetical protein